MKIPDFFFAQSEFYRQLAPQRTVCRDRSDSSYGFLYSERHLQCVWADSELRPTNLLTSDGELLEIVDPGRWNLEAGPDFLDAVIRINGERILSGDIEVHVHPADWVSHGHSGNPAFDRVVAHVTYYPSPVPEHLQSAPMLHIPLREPLMSRPGFFFESIDTAAYPYARRNPASPCSFVLNEAGPDRAVALLESAGLERMRLKSIRMSRLLAEDLPDQVFYAEFMAALGYKANANAFRALASRIPIAELRSQASTSEQSAYALLLGAAGLIPPRVPAEWPADSKQYARTLWDLWWKQRDVHEAAIMPTAAWSLSGLRPQNHPARRLAVVPALFGRTPDIQAQLAAVSTHDPGAWLKQTTTLLTSAVPSHEFWLARLSMSRPPASQRTAFIGSSRARAILVNLIIPLMAASETVSPETVAELCGAIPAGTPNAVVKEAASSLLGPHHAESLYGSALRQQGLIQIYSDFCMPDRSGCQSCTLPDALRGLRRD